MNDIHRLLGIEHVAMLAAMLLAMLLRPDEYTGHVGREPAQLTDREDAAIGYVG